MQDIVWHKEQKAVCHPEDSLYLDILQDNIQDNIADAKHKLLRANWAGGIDVQFATLNMASRFISSWFGTVNVQSIMANMATRPAINKDGLHVSARCWH